MLEYVMITVLDTNEWSGSHVCSGNLYNEVALSAVFVIVEEQSRLWRGSKN
jgi:hypothetical protein